MEIRITTHTAHVSGKLADAVLVFTTGALAGLQLEGFAIWPPRNEQKGLTVSFPSRKYTSNGQTANYTYLRSVSDSGSARQDLIDRILNAYYGAITKERI